MNLQTILGKQDVAIPMSFPMPSGIVDSYQLKWDPIK